MVPRIITSAVSTEQEAVRAGTGIIVGDAPGWFESHVFDVPRDATAPVVRIAAGGERLPAGPIVTGDGPES
jgi:hypothetical protein